MRLLASTVLATAFTMVTFCPSFAEPVTAKPGQHADIVLLPKYLGLAYFDEVNTGAQEANNELKPDGKLSYLGPTLGDSISGSIEIMTNAATQGRSAVMLSNNTGEQIVPAAEAAQKAGTHVVTWDSPIPSGKGEDFFVSPVDFSTIGAVLADMAYDILGGSGKMVILSNTPDAANLNTFIEALTKSLKGKKYSNIQVLGIAYGGDESGAVYNRAQSLTDQYPDAGLIMAMGTVTIQASAKAMQDAGECNRVKVTGLGMPGELASYTRNGCVPRFALWSTHDLGYLTYYSTYMLATGQISGKVGDTFIAGRLGKMQVEADPDRPGARRIIQGPFSVFTKDNIDKALQ